VELLHAKLRVYHAAEGSAQKEPARHTELRVSQMLHTHPRAGAEEHNDQAAKLVVGDILQQRKCRRQAATTVQHQCCPPRREPMFQQLVMDMCMVSREDRLM